VRNLDIAEVAQRSSVPASTLRFYEEKGLIASIGRQGLRRVFAAGVLERLALIAVGRAAGFSLEEMALMFAPDGKLRIDRQLLAAKAQELDKTIRQLSAMRDGQGRRPTARAEPYGVPYVSPHPAAAARRHRRTTEEIPAAHEPTSRAPSGRVLSGVDPAVDFFGARPARLACPRGLDLLQHRGTLGHVLLEQLTDFLLHGCVAAFRERFEAPDDTRRDVADGERPEPTC
jgi:DNA-binding transcriptional MerR regulator